MVDDALIIREVQRQSWSGPVSTYGRPDGNDALAHLAEAPSDLVSTDLQMPTWAATR